MEFFLNWLNFSTRYIDILKLNAKQRVFSQSRLDEYYVIALQNYRMAVAFTMPVLIIVENVDEKVQPYVREIINECEEMLANESIYIVTGKHNLKLSKELRIVVERAAEVVAHAGNICNNIIPSLIGRISEETLSVGMRARDICDRSMKIRHVE